jgi:CRISPR-associated protein Cas5h
VEHIVIFELRGPLAHYRRPDTLGTHASYPFIPRTTLRGLIAAVLGLEVRPDCDPLPLAAHCALRLMRPVRTVTQQLSLHGKKWIGAGPNESFHRPTTIELIIEPHYRVYFAGPLGEDLAARLQRKQSTFHTYLGSAFCLTFPEWDSLKPVEPIPDAPGSISCNTVVPSAAIARLDIETGRQYARVGGLLMEHIGGRRFRGTLSVIYEISGQPVRFAPAGASEGAPAFWSFRQVPGEGTVCLW